MHIIDERSVHLAAIRTQSAEWSSDGPPLATVLRLFQGLAHVHSSQQIAVPCFVLPLSSIILSHHLMDRGLRAHHAECSPLSSSIVTSAGFGRSKRRPGSRKNVSGGYDAPTTPSNGKLHRAC